MRIRHVLAVFILSLFPGFAFAENGVTPISLASISPPVWMPQGGETIDFDVRRNGGKFGHHIVRFERAEDGALLVENDIELTAKVGPITVYKYRHASEERWVDGDLVTLEGSTRKEGKNLTVQATRAGDVLSVEGSNFSGPVAADIIPSSHWNISELFADGMLSSEGGQVLPIETELVGREELEIGGEMIMTTHYRITSDMVFSMWYDEQGRWVKLALKARGQNVEYRLRSLY